MYFIAMSELFASWGTIYFYISFKSTWWLWGSPLNSMAYSFHKWLSKYEWFLQFLLSLNVVSKSPPSERGEMRSRLFWSLEGWRAHCHSGLYHVAWE